MLRNAQKHWNSTSNCHHLVHLQLILPTFRELFSPWWALNHLNQCTVKINYLWTFCVSNFCESKSNKLLALWPLYHKNTCTINWYKCWVEITEDLANLNYRVESLSDKFRRRNFNQKRTDPWPFSTSPTPKKRKTNKHKFCRFTRVEAWILPHLSVW